MSKNLAPSLLPPCPTSQKGHFVFQRTIQDLFEVEAGSGEKVEEFVVLHQEPSASEAISPRVARPYIQALHSIMDAQEEEEQQQQQQGDEDEDSVELAGKEEEQEGDGPTQEEPAHIEELNAVMEQVSSLCIENKGNMVKML